MKKIKSVLGFLLITVLFSGCPGFQNEPGLETERLHSNSDHGTQGVLDGSWELSNTDSDKLKSLAMEFGNQNFIEIHLKGDQGTLSLIGKSASSPEDCILSIPLQVTYDRTHCGCNRVFLDFQESQITESKPGCLNVFTAHDQTELVKILRPIFGIRRRYLKETTQPNEFSFDAQQATSMVNVEFEKKP